MISPRMTEFLQKPLSMNAGSRDQGLRPDSVRVLGPVGVTDEGRLTFYAPRDQAERSLHNYAQSQRVALVACDIPTFETYQFKGEFVAARECTAAEQSSTEAYLQQLVELLVELGYPRDLVAGWDLLKSRPCVRVEFNVAEVFHQTPGPDTGNAVTG